MSDTQQRRAEILRRTMTNELSRLEASKLLDIKERQLRRVISRLNTEGLASLVHGNTGRTPANKTPVAVREELAALAGEEGEYHDFNTCHMQEMLSEHNGIVIGRSTLDRWLHDNGTRKRKRTRPRRVFGRRLRKAREGEMLLTDGSQHDWLEGRDDRFETICLMGAIDDATSGIKHLWFWPTECQAGYITMARDITTTFGIPKSFYHDRHTILTSPKEQTIEDELARRKPMSQFGAILDKLGTESIEALTPQAKGRIERLWRTLQDRLIKEMRLARVNNLEEANAFLPRFIERFNNRFSVEAREPDAAWETVPDDLDLPFYFAAKEERMVKQDHTISFYGKTLLIKRLPGEPSIAGHKVQVHTTPEDESFVYSSGRRLEYTKLSGPLPRPGEPARQNDRSKPTGLRNQLAHGIPIGCRTSDATQRRTFSLSN